jgi:hypothetical protein
MSKDSGYLVITKSGKEGRTYHHNRLVNGRVVVYIEIDGKEVRMLCDPKTIKVIGCIN